MAQSFRHLSRTKRHHLAQNALHLFPVISPTTSTITAAPAYENKPTTGVRNMTLHEPAQIQKGSRPKLTSKEQGNGKEQNKKNACGRLLNSHPSCCSYTDRTRGNISTVTQVRDIIRRDNLPSPPLPGGPDDPPQPRPPPPRPDRRVAKLRACNESLARASPDSIRDTVSLPLFKRELE